MMNLREVEAEIVEGDPLGEEEEKGGQVKAEDRVVEEAKDLTEVGEGMEKVAGDHLVENLMEEEKEVEVAD